ncbi:SAP domain-containing protein [Erysipelothrix sp. HDW6B]|uniref:SAP domain-containing protein n=1 Tax=Erysipelothrix TaxID=1647 RepID=UPI001356873F|nr:MULTISPECIES: SAP domain-containing protein [Erysipelothrix]QIK85549.1 SAP domain-containing protein [Erysipelothrix sp. HDW6B]
MTKIKHPIYDNYPEYPYISPERDLARWEKYPEEFPYSKVEKKNMERLPEGLLPGDIIMLWRIGLGTFNNLSMIPNYFEYKYGINSDESLELLVEKGYAYKASAKESLDMLSIPVLKRILEENNLDKKGKKQDVLERVRDHVSENTLETSFPLRKYVITDAGRAVVTAYDAIIQKHGPKM